MANYAVKLYALRRGENLSSRSLLFTPTTTEFLSHSPPSVLLILPSLASCSTRAPLLSSFFLDSQLRIARYEIGGRFVFLYFILRWQAKFRPRILLRLGNTSHIYILVSLSRRTLYFHLLHIFYISSTHLYQNFCLLLISSYPFSSRHSVLWYLSPVIPFLYFIVFSHPRFLLFLPRPFAVVTFAPFIFVLLYKIIQ